MSPNPGFRPLSGGAGLLLLLLASLSTPSESSCPRGSCDLALGSYFLADNVAGQELNLTYISSLFGQTFQQILPYNPAITDPNFIISQTSINVSFPCDCLPGGFLGRTFSYVSRVGETYRSIATAVYANLTTEVALAAYNTYPADNITAGATVKVTLNCSCGDPAVSKHYGLFLTYPLRPGETLTSVAEEFGIPELQQLIGSYNPGVNFRSGEGIVFIPVKDANGSFRSFSTSTGLSGGGIGGISAAILVILIALSVTIYFKVYQRKVGRNDSTYGSMDNTGISLKDPTASVPADINMEKSVEFTYEELSVSTDGFSMAHKIGEGGFGAVYYGQLRGEGVAIKRMKMEASREFLAELKVLTHVHHLNLVRLIGYCTEGSLFLVYEYIDNGNLSQHLRDSDREPLSWPVRIQVALDSARGLEYIHEHTVPVYIHRDIKSANILIDKKLHAKVADFGLAKLTQAENVPTSTSVVGTFGYMPPEYAQHGDVSPKVDIYAFGVVLYELVSAKEAVTKTESSAEKIGLVTLFNNAHSQPDPIVHLQKLIDPRLGDNYHTDSVLKVVEIAKACTEEFPNLRPSMRSIVIALMTLSSSTDQWDIGNFYGDQAILNLMSGR